MVYLGELDRNVLKSILMAIQAGVSCKWTNDGQRFLLEHFDIIHDCPSQLYFSALPFCPSSSWLHKHYTAELSQVVRVVKGLLTEWGMCSRTVKLPSSTVLTCWNNTIAIGERFGKIILLNAIIGNQLALLSEHTDQIRSLTFSLDGTFLVSGSNDKTVLLWDVQTGGVVKSFCGHTDKVLSVSISLDHTTIASGSQDHTIRLWNIQTGECNCVIARHGDINSVSFSLTDPQHLISASNSNTIEHWDTKGCQIGSACEGRYVVFSPDGSCFISWWEKVATIRNSDSGVVVAELQVPSDKLECCCFSPNGNLVAGGAGRTIYVWDTTGSDPRLIETLVGHTGEIESLTFSSSLTSIARDGLVKFWQIGASPMNPVAADIIPIPPTIYRINSTSLQTRDGIAITCNSAGEVKAWDLTTGLCKASFQTPAKGNIWRDAQLIEGRLVLAWWKGKKINIWDAEKVEVVQTMSSSWSDINGISGIRISGDGSKVFCPCEKSILAWSIWTGDIIGRVELEGDLGLDPLYADGSKVWVSLSDSSVHGWDFGPPGSSPTPLSNTSSNRPRLELVDGHSWSSTSPNKVKDMVTGDEIFQLPRRYGNPLRIQWDGQYLVAGYDSGEVLILDFNQVLPQ